MKNEMLNVTVGPVMMDKTTRRIGGDQLPYFRTQNFSEIMLKNEVLFKQLLHANDEDRVVFLTGSGTAGMEMAVANTLLKSDKVLVINGGSFGARFCQLCDIYEIENTVIKLQPGESLKKSHLDEYSGQDYTALLVNMHETSTGVLYDMNMIGDFCRQNHLFLIVDAISAFLADFIDMAGMGIDVLITASQKALALPPGIAALVLNKTAQNRVQKAKVKSIYLDMKEYLLDGKRGQTPFTPAVSVLLQLHERLNYLAETGITKETKRIQTLAGDFRDKIQDLPFSIFAETPSNAVTALRTEDSINAYELFLYLEKEENIWVCPNGGELKNRVFRVGHIGDLSLEDNTRIAEALKRAIKQMKNGRIKSEKVELDYHHIQNFFEERGKVKKLPHKYNYVLYQDDCPELAVKRDRQEKEKISKLLDLKAGKRALDIGCGIGRWGELLLEKDIYYVGMDASENMIIHAEENLRKYQEKKLVVGVFQQLIEKLKEYEIEEKFDFIFVNGVFMYLNDNDFKKAISDIKECCKKNCKLYLKESMGIKERLTLKDVFSNDLTQNYNAIYRSIEEYHTAFTTGFGNEFEIKAEGNLFTEELGNRKETTDYYYILQRRKCSNDI